MLRHLAEEAFVEWNEGPVQTVDKFVDCFDLLWRYLLAIVVFERAFWLGNKDRTSALLLLNVEELLVTVEEVGV